jgi:hypothetical protein
VILRAFDVCAASQVIFYWYDLILVK